MNEELRPITVDTLTEAVATGVMRAVAARRADDDSGIDFDKAIAENGLFGTVIVTCGTWPTDRGGRGGIAPPTGELR
jgi:hypothetical protein